MTSKVLAADFAGAVADFANDVAPEEKVKLLAAWLFAITKERNIKGSSPAFFEMFCHQAQDWDLQEIDAVLCKLFGKEKYGGLDMLLRYAERSLPQHRNIPFDTYQENLAEALKKYPPSVRKEIIRSRMLVATYLETYGDSPDQAPRGSRS